MTKKKTLIKRDKIKVISKQLQLFNAGKLPYIRVYRHSDGKIIKIKKKIL